jgi:sulfite reductase (NADPH) hemoprotein beta-component
MYIYDQVDQRLVDERVAQFRDQTRRFLDGKLSEDEFRALRLRNGLYIQRYAPMLRIAIPYGLLSSRQLRKLAQITRRLRPRLRPLLHAPEPAAQLAAPR